MPIPQDKSTQIANMIPESITTYSFPAVMKWVGAFVVASWTRVPHGIQVLGIFMLLDILVGFLVAWRDGKVTAALMRKGLINKSLVLVVLLTCHVAEKEAGIEVNLETIGAIGYSINELISIIENIAKAGVSIPKPLVDALLNVKKLKGQSSASEEDIKRLEDDDTPTSTATKTR